MTRIGTSLFVFALVALMGFVPQIASAGTIFTLPPNDLIFDTGQFGGVNYAGGRVTGAGVNPLLFNLSSMTQVSILVPQYNGHAATSATVTSIDSSSGIAWISINYGAGVGSRTGSVSVSGGTVTLNQFSTTTGTSSTFVNAAAGGNAFGLNGQGQPSVTQSGGSWSPLTSPAGNIYDAVFGGGKTTAVGNVANSAGGANAAVFTNLTLTMQHDCGTSFCSLQSVSSDGLWGGLAFDNQVGLLNLTTNQQFLLSGDAQVRGVLGGANPVLFYQSATGPRAWTLGGADLDFGSWYLAVNGTSLGFVPTDVGDARVFAGQVYQSIAGSSHVGNYSDPSTSATSTPEPGTWLLMATGLAGLGLFGWRRRYA